MKTETPLLYLNYKSPPKKILAFPIVFTVIKVNIELNLSYSSITC